LSITLRQKSALGLFVVAMVSLVVLLGTRLLGKAALFHYQPAAPDQRLCVFRPCSKDASEPVGSRRMAQP
jgi:hypothetical protein